MERTELKYRALALFPPLVAGGLLRGWGISRQVLGGDEFHALWAATDLPLREILIWTTRPDFRFRNQIEPTPVALLASGARYFVVHLDPIGEAEKLGARGTSLFDDVAPWSPRLRARPAGSPRATG